MFSSCRAADGGGPDHSRAGLGRTREDGPVGIVAARFAAPDGPTRSWWPRAGWPGMPGWPGAAAVRSAGAHNPRVG